MLDVPAALRDPGEAVPLGLAADGDVTQGRERRLAQLGEAKVSREAEPVEAAEVNSA